MRALQQRCCRMNAAVHVRVSAVARAACAPPQFRHHSTQRSMHRQQHRQSALVRDAAAASLQRPQLRTGISRVRAAGTDSGSSATKQRQEQQRSITDAQQDWDIKMLYDGDCPLCMREVNMLKRRDAERGSIKFVDIAAPDYSPADNANISFEQAMGEIHAINRDGTVIKNIEVFARLYEAVGLGWVYGFTKYEPLRRAADAVYAIWARFRLPITGREDLETILRRREDRTCR